jgi:hypothetical protein
LKPLLQKLLFKEQDTLKVCKIEWGNNYFLFKAKAK